jgi:hypothetical protein
MEQQAVVCSQLEKYISPQRILCDGLQKIKAEADAYLVRMLVKDRS